MKSNIALEDLAQLMGGIVAQFVLMAIYSSSCVPSETEECHFFYFVRLALVGGASGFCPGLEDPPLAWVWVGLIYQVRLRKKPRLL